MIYIFKGVVRGAIKKKMKFRKKNQREEWNEILSWAFQELIFNSLVINEQLLNGHAVLIIGALIDTIPSFPL